jgi:hypothetical protein
MDINAILKNHSDRAEEIIKKAIQSNKPEDLLTIAKEYGVDIDVSQVEELFSTVKQLSEDELDMVAGGKTDTKPCPSCGSYEYGTGSGGPDGTFRYCSRCGYHRD